MEIEASGSCPLAVSPEAVESCCLRRLLLDGPPNPLTAVARQRSPAVPSPTALG